MSWIHGDSTFSVDNACHWSLFFAWKKSVLIFLFYYFKASFNIGITSTPMSSRLPHSIRFTDHNLAGVLLASLLQPLRVPNLIPFCNFAGRSNPSVQVKDRLWQFMAHWRVLGHHTTLQAEGRPPSPLFANSWKQLCSRSGGCVFRSWPEEVPCYATPWFYSWIL